MKTYNRGNCTGIIRGQFTDQYGRKVTISGTHAFEYTIEITIKANVTFTERYPNGKEAHKRFNNLKRVR